MGAQERAWERRGESRGDHGGQPTRCACGRVKRGPQWVWGTVGVFDPDPGFGLGVDSGSEFESEPGRIQMVVGTVGIPEH